MKKLVITIVLMPVFLVVLVAAAILTVLNWPTLVINETTLGMAKRHLVPLGVNLEWTSAASSMESHGFLDETVGLVFSDLCVSVEPMLTKACFKRFDVHARYRFEWFTPHIVAIGPITIENGDIVATIQAGDKDKKGKIEGALPIPHVELPHWLRRIELHTVAIALDAVEVRMDASTYKGSAEIKGMPDAQHRITSVSAAAAASESPSGRSFQLDALVESPSGFIDSDWRLQMEAKASLGAEGSATVQGNVAVVDGNKLDHELTLSYAKGELRTTATLAGRVGEDTIETTLTGAMRGISDVVPAIEVPQCALKLIATNKLLNRGSFTLSCPVDIKLKKFTVPPEMKNIYQPPERMRIEISSRANTFFVPDPDANIDGTLEVRVQPLQDRLVTTRGEFKVSFAGVPSKPLKKWRIESDIDLDFIIERFAKLIKVLDTTAYRVPAPFNTLEGSIEFSLSGHLSNVTELGQFPATFTTRLHSEKQRIDIDSEGEVSFGFGGRKHEGGALELEVTLADVQLQLPSISLAGIPRFTPDGRIILGPAAQEEHKGPDLPFDYRVHVVTPENNSVRILSNITPMFIPVAVDVVLANDGITGTVSITTFPIKLFSRTATLDKMHFDLKKPMEASVVDGSLSFEFPELKAFIVMQGPLEHPRIALESKPPMSQGDIISTLLYGEPMNGIDSDQADSVSNMSAAMTSRAMALTSFFLLGSTPIQSIAYDPSSGMFSARVKLGSKASLVVGASGSERQAMIRKRLGKGFSISAGADKTDDSSQTAGTAYIEWSKRF